MCILVCWFYFLPAKAEVLVITHPSVDTNQISATYLSRVYAMQIKSWPSGQPIKVFSFTPQSDEFKEFVVNKAKLQPHQLNRHWKRLLFTGTGRIPTTVNSTDQMIEKVSTTPGSIGYINSTMVPSNTKALYVEGVK